MGKGARIWTSSGRRPGIGQILPGVFLVAVLAGGLLLTLRNPAFYSLSANQDVLRGKWAASFQSAYEQGLALRGPAVTVWTLLRYLFFAECKTGVLVGDDGWLFSSEEFAEQPRVGEVEAIGLEHIREVHESLSAQKVRLVVALVPAKARIYSEQLGRYALPAAVLARYEAFRSGLVGLGIEAPDLVEPLRQARDRGEVFLRTDTHWTPFGAQVVAEVLAAHVVPALEARRSERGSFVTTLGEQIQHRGDLLNFIPLGPFAETLGPKPDTLVPAVTVRSDEPKVGLFDELTIPVVLVGTSYSSGTLWNFEGALKTAVAADVLNAAREGRGPLAPMQSLLGGGVLEDVHPDVVVWEIPERYVRN